MRGRRGALALAILLAVTVLIALALRPTSTAEPDPTPNLAVPTPSRTGLASFPSGASSLAGLLARLTISAEDRSGYERSLFEHWIDADGDGCDTRREVLISESLTSVTISSSCDLGGGTWRSLYDGVETVDPSDFDVDHVVPLAEAWDSGASTWTPARRRRFANDMDVVWALIAVSAASNRSKGDQDPAEWLPPLAETWCTYAEMWIAVKVRWRLAIDVAEASALTSLISRCDQRITVPPAS